MTNHVVLYEPLMPANTGNIARTCAGTNTVLDLIEPLGFQIDNKKMKRAGLDYWDKVEVHMHDDLNAFLKTLGPDDEMYLISKFSSKNYTEVDYTDKNKNYYFVFGKETTGLPETFMREYYDRNLEFQCLIIFVAITCLIQWQWFYLKHYANKVFQTWK